MKLETFQGIVENGQIRLAPDARLPERATVYVVVTAPPALPGATIPSVRLAQPDRAPDFELEMSPERRDA